MPFVNIANNLFENHDSSKPASDNDKKKSTQKPKK
jgi:hypothetical protein